MSDAAIIGDCGVCGNPLKSGENHAFTACKHLFCISCLLKWHAHSVNPTCPLCRADLYAADPDHASDSEHDALAPIATAQTMMTNHILREIDFDVHESIMHQHMLEVVETQAIQHCNESELHCVFMGEVNLSVIPAHEHEDHHPRIEVGPATPNAHYIVILSGTSNTADEFRRCRFGRIEEMRVDPIAPDVKWVAFRERISVIDEAREEHTTAWDNETMQLNLREVVHMVQYIPRIRAHM